MGMLLAGFVLGWPVGGRGVTGELMSRAGTVLLPGLITGVCIRPGHGRFVGTSG
jgi:hypothetical protein